MLVSACPIYRLAVIVLSWLMELARSWASKNTEIPVRSDGKRTDCYPQNPAVIRDSAAGCELVVYAADVYVPCSGGPIHRPHFAATHTDASRYHGEDSRRAFTTGLARVLHSFQMITYSENR
jgi:hypothetical protein